MSLSIPNTEPRLIKRARLQYDLRDQKKMGLEKRKILIELELLEISGESHVFENQEITASRIVTEFKNRKIINVMVVAKTQSGKTGSMCDTIRQYLEDTTNLIPIENIYIITGLSSCEWLAQMKERLPSSIHNRVFHRCELPTTFADDIESKKNILIIMDEIQVAAKKGQTIYNTFKIAGLLNKKKLYESDVKILEYTATPDGTIYDLMKWGEASSKIIADAGEGYVGSYDLFRKGRVKQYKELCGYDKETGQIDEKVFENIREIKTDVDNYEKPMYHIIRTKNGSDQDLTIQNFRKVFDIEKYEFIKYDRGSDIEDINKTLIIPPKKPTFIFIKEMLRCAKTLKKKFMGVSYERYSKFPDDATIIQGLVGRNTGYDDNGISICYTNIESIERYEALFQSKFEDTSIKWNSKTTKYAKGTLSGKNTYLNIKNYTGFSVENEPVVKKNKKGGNKKPKIEPEIQLFDTQEEAKSFYNRELKEIMKGRGPNEVKPNENGYYEATIRSEKKVYSCDEINEEKKHGLSSTKNSFRLYPSYVDVNDKSTLKWKLIYYIKPIEPIKIEEEIPK